MMVSQIMVRSPFAYYASRWRRGSWTTPKDRHRIAWILPADVLCEGCFLSSWNALEFALFRRRLRESSYFLVELYPGLPSAGSLEWSWVCQSAGPVEQLTVILLRGDSFSDELNCWLETGTSLGMYCARKYLGLSSASFLSCFHSNGLNRHLLTGMVLLLGERVIVSRRHSHKSQFLSWTFAQCNMRWRLGFGRSTVFSKSICWRLGNQDVQYI